MHPRGHGRRGDPGLRRPERRLWRTLRVVRTTLVIGLACALAGCVPPYRPPTADEPHATLKVRRIYEKVAGTRLDERVEIEGHSAIAQSVQVSMAAAPRTDGLLVHPRPARVALASTFVHQEMRTVQEPYTETEYEYTTESYSCGTYNSFQMCSRMVSRPRQVTKYRWVTKLVDVTDATCSKALVIAPADGHLYLIDYTFQDGGVCAASCAEQVVVGADGSFANRRCPIPTPAQIKTLDDED
jgi:hypothetical protein